MKLKQTSNEFTASLSEDLAGLDLIEELSDEEAGACVGGCGYLNPQGKEIGKPYREDDKPYNGNGCTPDPNGSGRFMRSDRNAKERFAAVDVQDVLDKVATLSIETWNYKDEEQTIRHIGPMAQDFAAAFSVGEDNRFINTVDASGVALAAIQALYKQLQQKDAAITVMRAELDELKQQMLANKVQESMTVPAAALNCN
jgi:hypothetical protein